MRNPSDEDSDVGEGIRKKAKVSQRDQRLDKIGRRYDVEMRQYNEGQGFANR